MSEKITIRLFDDFCIMKGDKQILTNLSNTRKTKLFVAYLLAHRDRSISHQELFELLWSGEEYANPATALRTLLYRFRSMIDAEGADALAGAIISRRGTYQWNKNLDINIDALEFEDMAIKGLNMENSLEERRAYLESAIELYRGSLLPDFCSEPWLISKAAAYRDRYVDVVESYINILKAEKAYGAIASLCDKAQKLAGRSELLELEGQMAKLRLASPETADKNTVSVYYDEVRELSINLRSETDRLQAELEDDTVEQKAYLCDYETFKEIYRLQRRVQSRSKATIFLGIMEVRDDSEEGKPVGESTISEVLECCQRQLRCGDSICHINKTQIAVLFPAESYEDAMGVLERLKIASKERTDEDVVIVYRVRPLKNARE